MTLSSIPVAVWIVGGILIAVAFQAFMSGVTVYVLHKGHWVTDEDVKLGAIFMGMFFVWPLAIAIAAGWNFMQWFTSPSTPKPIPLPPEVKEKRC